VHPRIDGGHVPALVFLFVLRQLRKNEPVEDQEKVLPHLTINSRMLARPPDKPRLFSFFSVIAVHTPGIPFLAFLI
jgi:hypothetical protein